MTLYKWNKEAFLEALKPQSITTLFHKMELTPSQMQTFFKTEPNIHRLMVVKHELMIDPLTLLVPR